MIQIGGKVYELFYENRNGWNADAFKERYSEVLERYDYIVGDWGYNQLRLKGFYKDNHMKATKDSIFSSSSDYINEYCNFGCAYFVLEKTGSVKKSPEEEGIEEEDGGLKAESNSEYRRYSSDDSLISAIAEAAAAAVSTDIVNEPAVDAAAPASKPNNSTGARSEDQQSPQRSPRQDYRRNHRSNGGDRSKKPFRSSSNRDAGAGASTDKAHSPVGTKEKGRN
ncbi:MAG: YutD family protein [Candidatus Pristimantibacillus sp.]